ncbi:MAG TPA: IucA/IucC family protein [Oligoflexus sp.]|uniref:IucA/IucC family protein n=1 Tax=Oligoflexus sp. TaxID=1971216 RepID=UPI002D2C2236|nr:IucA/IucC family protein [Oligoflexus sp.]HYX32674.1 IucA/IucC family protein [Oligoflexus sp.]
MNARQAHDWILVNQRLVAKAIAEMSFEQLLKPALEEDGYSLALSSGVRYRFTAWVTIWDFLRIEAVSLRRQPLGSMAWDEVTSAGQFFLDAQAETAMDDIILGNFMEEMHRTLFADMKLLSLQRNHSSASMIEMDGDTLQGLLDGHPKALLNKGRMGWGSPDLDRFAPESMPSFQLFWIAVSRETVEQSKHPAWTSEQLLDDSMQADERVRFQQTILALDVSPERYEYMPVHPWQWEQVIEQQFAGAIAFRSIVPLGLFGDRYRPQTSLRTMSNVDRPECLQIKLSISILNTSCVRGLPARYVAVAPQLSLWLAQICERDPLLQRSGARVLQDVASMHRQHEHYIQVKEAPYRYHEYLGVVWRESSQARLQRGEQAVITAALFQKDAQGEALLVHWLERSGLNLEAWLRAYFQVVVIPLYHLQCKYGIGMVAHGQNTVLRLDQGRPVGMYLKDLQGDLRIIDEDWPELETLAPTIRAKLTRLPAHYLIHDLQTGHFITVLRFLSATLYETMRYSEESFYQILTEALEAYGKSQPELAERIRQRSLLEPTMIRVLINKVRFKIGYADHAERPVPALGTELINPLSRRKLGGNHVSPTL